MIGSIFLSAALVFSLIAMVMYTRVQLDSNGNVFPFL